MPSTIYEDYLARPELFRWYGISEPEFKTWLTALPLRVHPGLVSFWERTGGGELFESETLLGPLVPDDADNVLKASEFHWNRGMSRDLMVFHTGLCLSASSVDMRRHRNRLVVFKPESYEIAQWFDTFNLWYQKTLRSEFAERYGLASG
jgi:hypothetical protein